MYDEETEEFIGNVEQLSGDIADLTKTAKNSGGISLFKDADKTEYKSTYQLLKEISSIWNDLTDKQQAGLLEKLAGKRGGQVLAGILSDFSEVERAMTEMGRAAGSADSEMSIISESWEYKLNNLKGIWEGLLQELIDRGTIGRLIDNLAKISEVLVGIITHSEKLIPILTAIGGVYLIKNSSKIISGLTSFVVLLADIASSGNAVASIFKVLGGDLSQAGAEIGNLSSAFGLLAEAIGVSKLALAGFIGVAAGITVAITALHMYREAQEKAAKAAADSASKIKDTQEAIDDQISKYKELSDKLKDTNLTEDEQYEIKKQLYELQKNLNETYGDEASKLDLVNGKYETQLELLKQISQEKAQEYIQEHQSDYNKAEKRLNKKHNRTINLGGVEVDPQVIKYLKGYSALRDLNEDGSGPAAFSIKLNDDEAEATLRKLYNDVQKFGKDTGLNVQSTLDVISDQIKTITEDETFKADKQFVAEFNKQAVLADNDLRSVYSKGIDAVEQYNKALATNEGVDEARKNLNAVRTEFDKYKDNVSGSEEVFKSVWGNINTAAEQTLLIEERLNDKTTRASKLAEQFKGINDFELQDIDFNGTNLSKKQQAFVDLANSLGINKDNAQALIDKLVDLGYVIGSTADKVEELKEETDDALDFSRNISNLNDLESALNDIGTAMSNIDENGQFQLGDLDKIADYFLGLEDVTYEVQEVNNALKLLGEGTGTIEEQANAINVLADNYLHTSNILDGLTESNKQLYITRLEMMGIINAEEIVEAQLTAALLTEAEASAYLADVKAQVVVKNGELVVSEGQAIDAMVKDGKISQDTARQIAYFAYQKDFANKTVIKTDADIANLLSLMKTAGAAADSIARVAQMKSMLADVESGKTIMSATRVKNMQKAIADIANSAMSEVRTTISNVPQAQYNGGSAVKNKLGKSPTSTAGALKDLGNKAIKDAADKAAKGAKDDEKELEDTYDEFFDYFERRVKVLTDAISLLDAHLENVVGSAAKNKLLDAQERIYKMQQQEYADAKRMYEEMANKALAKIPDNIKNDIINGAVAIDEFIGKGNEEVVQAMQDYTKWADKIAECKQQLAELKEQLRQLELKRFKNIAQDWQDLFDLRQNNAIDLIDKQIDLFEEAGQLIGKSFYEEQKAQAQKQYELLSNERKALVDELNRGLSNGTIEIGSDEWLEMRGILSDLEGQILDCAKAIETFDNAILQLHVDVFERIQGQLDDFDDQLSDMASFLDDADVSNKYGEWSQEGMARAGLLAQQFDLANKKVHDYAEEIEWLNEQYKLGKYSTTEYMDRLADLMSEQRDAAQTADDMKDAMVELNRDRVDIVIDGINEEIKAYEELIDAQKKALQAQKDLHDYEKQVADENKAIVDIERQLAAIRNDDSAAANAKRKQLEAQLKDAQDQLSETEYDHSITAQEDALDAQMEQYRQMREAEIQSWEEYAANIEQVMIDMLAMVQANAFEIGTVITETATAHGFQISQALTDPWFTAQQTIAQYGEVLSAETSSFIASLESVEQETWNLQAQADATSVQLAQMFGNRADNLVNELQRSWESEQNLANMTHALSDAFVQALDSGYRIGEVVNPLESAKAATDALANAADSAASAFDGMADSARRAAQEAANANSMPTTSSRGTPYEPPYKTHVTTLYNAPSSTVKWDRIGGYYRYYVKGLSKADKDQLAWTQELGDEVIVSPTRSSILTPIKKGDAVIDAKGTQNLFELAKVDPKQLLNGMSSASTPTLQQNKAFGVNISSLVTVNGPINDSLAMMKIAANEAQSKITKTLKDLSDEIKY